MPERAVIIYLISNNMIVNSMLIITGATSSMDTKARVMGWYLFIIFKCSECYFMSFVLLMLLLSVIQHEIKQNRFFILCFFYFILGVFVL